MRLKYVWILSLALAWCVCPARAGSDAGGKHLFILSGQSNMARFDPNPTFIPAVEAAFGKENVIVVKDAHAGQPIRRWYKKWDDAGEPAKTPPGDLYDPLIAKVRQAIKGEKIQTVTFLWMQGESDAVQGKAAKYEESLNGVIAQLETDLDWKEMHLVIGRLSDHAGKKPIPDWQRIRDIQVHMAETRPHSAWVDTDDLNDVKDATGKKINDDLHYTKEGYALFGKRLAEKAIALIVPKTGAKP